MPDSSREREFKKDRVRERERVRERVVKTTIKQSSASHVVFACVRMGGDAVGDANDAYRYLLYHQYPTRMVLVPYMQYVRSILNCATYRT